MTYIVEADSSFDKLLLIESLLDVLQFNEQRLKGSPEIKAQVEADVRYLCALGDLKVAVLIKLQKSEDLLELDSAALIDQSLRSGVGPASGPPLVSELLLLRVNCVLPLLDHNRVVTIQLVESGLVRLVASRRMVDVRREQSLASAWVPLEHEVSSLSSSGGFDGVESLGLVGQAFEHWLNLISGPQLRQVGYSRVLLWLKHRSVKQSAFAQLSETLLCDRILHFLFNSRPQELVQPTSHVVSDLFDVLFAHITLLRDKFRSKSTLFVN